MNFKVKFLMLIILPNVESVILNASIHTGVTDTMHTQNFEFIRTVTCRSFNCIKILYLQK